MDPFTKHISKDTSEKKPVFVIVIGKGGVGKTTISILISHELAKNNNVLLVSLDQAMHLIEYLGLKKPMKKTLVKNNLTALQVDVNVLIKKESIEYVNLLQSIMPGLTVVSADDVVKSLKFNPGFEEEVYMRFLSKLFNEEEYDFVVVDTPPTGVTYRMLSLPRLYLFWLEQLIKLRNRIINLKYVIARTMGRDVKPSDPVLSRLHTLKKEYEKLLNNLRNKERTKYVCVLTPEPLPLFETQNTIKFLEDMKTSASLVVVNRLLSEDSAENLGVKKVQDDVMSKLMNITCAKKIPTVAIMHSATPPRTLGEALSLLDLIKELECS